MGYYSRRDLESIARKVTKAYYRLMEQRGETAFRIDPEFLATGLLHLSIKRYHLSKDGEILGLTSPVEFCVEVYDDQMAPLFCTLDGNTILVEKDLWLDAPLGRYQFTVMHEVAHQLLSRMERSHKAVVYQSTADRSPVRDWREWQADVLASALLMPRDLVQRVLTIVGLPHGIYLLDKELFSDDYMRFRDAAATLRVSQTAFAIRLKHLGLLQYNDLHWPGGIVDIVREEDDEWNSKCVS